VVSDFKNARQRKILEIVAQQVIGTQEEIARLLREKGYPVTQATVSRDIKELGLIKIPIGQDQYRYAIPQEPQEKNIFSRLQRFFRDSVIHLDYSENLIVIKTLTGNAHAVASCIDQTKWDEIIGTVAGDDTILVIVKPKSAVLKVLKKFNSLLE
jgi:transcriptional regulator of arginine metabolism